MKREQQRDICYNEFCKTEGAKDCSKKDLYSAGWIAADNTNLQGWRPVSEKPILNKGEDDVEFIVLTRFKTDGHLWPERATYCPYTGWSHDGVEWWIALPKKIKLIP